jgi:hypothetical protein
MKLEPHIPGALLTRTELALRYGVSRRTLDRRIARAQALRRIDAAYPGPPNPDNPGGHPSKYRADVFDRWWRNQDAAEAPMTRKELARRYNVHAQTVDRRLTAARECRRADPARPAPPEPVNPDSRHPKYLPAEFDQWWQSQKTAEEPMTRAELARRYGTAPYIIRRRLTNAWQMHYADPSRPAPPDPVNPDTTRPRYLPAEFDRWWQGLPDIVVVVSRRGDKPERVDGRSRGEMSQYDADRRYWFVGAGVRATARHAMVAVDGVVRRVYTLAGWEPNPGDQRQFGFRALGDAPLDRGMVEDLYGAGELPYTIGASYPVKRGGRYWIDWL